MPEATASAPFAACVRTWRLDFSSLRRDGSYQVRAGTLAPVTVRIARAPYRAAADSLLVYMRQQRSGYNPFFGALVHQRDGIVVGDSPRAGEFVGVSGGWADASDYLQYVTTSANATFVMLKAYRDHPRAFGDAFDGASHLFDRRGSLGDFFGLLGSTGGDLLNGRRDLACGVPRRTG